MNSSNELFLPGRTVWAWHPARGGHEAGFVLFKRIVRCAGEENFHLAVSADNRYTLYLDGKLLGRGPVRGSLDHYYYDEYAGTLSRGEHVFAAEVIVWNDAWRKSPAPWSEMHAGGGFLAAGYAGNERLELPEKWFTSIDAGRRPRTWEEAWDGPAVNPAPPPDEVDFNHHDCNWLFSGRTDAWQTPVVIGAAVFHGQYQVDPATPWQLEPRPVRPMVQTFTPIAEILAAPSCFQLENGILRGACIPAGKHRILLDLGRNQTSMIHFSGTGGNGFCRVAYSELLFNKAGEYVRQPSGGIGRRGYADLLILPRTEQTWNYHSFWYRSGRFIELEMTLKSNLYDAEFRVEFITYDFGRWREFHAPQDAVLEKIYEVGCHTLRCCTHENFEDCPYYEQLQYAGDSRIHALVAYAATGDDSMARQMLRALDYSRMSNGLTQSRYPSTFRQIIPGYSLIWVLMIHDHHALFHDHAFTRELMPGVDSVLAAFERQRLGNGLIGPLEGWHFTDWTADWPLGASDRGELIPETILNLFYAEACCRAAELKDELGMDGAALRRQGHCTLEAVNSLCYDAARGRYQDAAGRAWFSLHCNVLAVLFGAVQEERRHVFLREVLEDMSLTQPTLYFEFYILSAIRRCGTSADFRKRLAPWEKMLDAGFTTFPETPYEHFRSACHAWSTAPVWFLCGEEKYEPRQ